MADDSLIVAWWKRLTGTLRPAPFPYDQAAILHAPGRSWVAGPRRILGAFGFARGESVLEIGPGTGFYSIEAARRVGDTGRLICLDVQSAMLVETRRRITAAGLRAGFVRASGTRLPLRSACLDHIYLVAVLGELPDRAAALLEFRRVLRPGGRLSVSEQLPDPDYITRRALRRELSAAGFIEERTRGALMYTSTWRSGVLPRLRGVRAMRWGPVATGIAMCSLTSCAGEMPTVQDANDAVLMLRAYGSWAWALGIGLIWADLFLPVSQTTVIAALGIIYGVGAGGLLGTVALITGGLLGYVLMWTSARRLVVRLVGERSMQRTQVFFDRAGAWAIILSRSLPYSMPEVLVFLAGLAGMPLGKFLLAMSLGSVPTAFVYAAIGAGWSDQPVLALAISYLLPIASLPPALYLIRTRGQRRSRDGPQAQTEK